MRFCAWIIKKCVYQVSNFTDPKKWDNNLSHYFTVSPLCHILKYQKYTLLYIYIFFRKTKKTNSKQKNNNNDNCSLASMQSREINVV